MTDNNTPLRIGIDATVAIKGMAGVSEYARQVITNLSAIDSENDYELATFSLFRSHTRPLPKLKSNFHEHKIMLPASLIESRWNNNGWPPLSAFTGKSDVLFYPRPLISNSRIPTVVTVHDLSWILMPELAETTDHTLYKQALDRAVHESKAIIAISQATKDDLIKVYHLDPDKITVTHLGYDTSLTEPASEKSIEEFKNQYHLNEAPYFLHVGTLEPRKNLARLVKAFTIFKQKSGLNHKLVLVGRNGWLYQDILDEIERSSAKEDIVVTGPIDNRFRPAAYWGAFAVVFPSLYEGFGLPIIEAQAAKRPVITGTGGSLGEIGADSVLAVNVKDENEIATAMIKLAADDQLRSELVQKGLENIKRFSWETCAKETLEVIKRTADRR